MLLAIKYGALIEGAGRDVVLGHHTEDKAPPAGAYPGCVVIGWSGDVNALPRVGFLPPGVPPELDGRLHEAPAFDPVAYAAARRWMLVRAGITLNGTFVPTDDASRQGYGDAARRAGNKPGDTIVNVKVAGAWVAMPASQLIALDTAVGNHEQACFDAEEAIDAAVAAGGQPGRADIEAQFKAKVANYSPIA